MRNGMPSGPGALLGMGLKTACQIFSGLVCGVSSRGVGYMVPGMSDRSVGSAWGKKRSRRISTLCPVSLQSMSTVSLRGGNCGGSGALCETDGVTIVVQTVWLREERGLSLCRPVAGTIGSAVGLKR